VVAALLGKESSGISQDELERISELIERAKGKEAQMIKATLILLVAMCIATLMRRRSAAERHMVWAAAIISATLLPVFSGFMPSWQVVLGRQHRESAAGLAFISPARSSRKRRRRCGAGFGRRC